MAGWLDEHAAGEPASGVAVQGTWRAGTGEVAVVALAAADGTAAWLDAASSPPRTTRPWRPGSPTRRGPRCCTTPRARCWRWPRAAGRSRGLVSDTALAAYLVRPDQRSYDLADLTLRYLKRELRRTSRRRPGPADLRRPVEATDVAGDAAMLHARAVLDLAEALDDAVEEHGGARLLAEVELPLVDLLAEMEQTGIAVDIDHLEALESPLRRAR